MRTRLLRLLASSILVCASITITAIALGQEGEEKVSPSTFADAFGDPLPEGAVARLGTVRFRERKGIQSIAFSPDLRRIATAYYQDSTVTLWNGETGEVLREIDLGGSHAGSLAFSPDGMNLSIGAEDTILFYQVDGEGEPERIHVPRSGRRAMIGSRPAVRHLAYSQDGRVLAGAEYKAIHIWDVESGERLRTIPAKVGYSSSLALSSDGKTLAAGCAEMRIRCWEIKTGKETLEIKVPPPSVDPRFNIPNTNAQVGRIAFSPDGKVIANAGPRFMPEQETVYLWDAVSGEKIGSIGEGGHGFLSVAFSPDGKKLAVGGGYRGQLQMWDWKSGGLLKTFPSGSVAYLAFSRDGKRLASVSDNPGTIQIWDLASGERIPDFHVHDGFVESLAYSPDGKTIATGGAEGPIFLWDAETGRSIRRIRGHDSRVESLLFSEDGAKLISHGWDNQLRFWDVSTGAATFSVPVSFRWMPMDVDEVPPQFLERYRKRATTSVISPDGARVATGHATGGVRIWNVGSGEVEQKISAHPRAVVALALLDGGKRIISCSTDGDLAAWETDTGKEIQRWKVPVKELGCVALSPDEGTIACGDGDGTIHLRDLASGEVRRFLGKHEWGVSSIWFSPQGDLLLSRGVNPSEARREDESFDVIGTSAMFKVWEVASGREILALKAYSDWTSSEMDEESVYSDVVFGPDGHTLAACGLGLDVYLIEIATGQVYRKFSGHTRNLNQVDFSPDGRTLASASNDTTVLVWDIAPPAAAPTLEVEEIQFEALWESLAQEDAAAAYGAMVRLASLGDEAVGFLRTRVHPAHEKNREKIEELIAHLDADEFRMREEATVELEALGEEAEPALRRALSQGMSPEAEQRIRSLLRAAGPPYKRFPNAKIQVVRALRAIERIGTAPARALLQDLAAGSEWAARTREATAALRRLEWSSPTERTPKEF